MWPKTRATIELHKIFFLVLQFGSSIQLTLLKNLSGKKIELLLHEKSNGLGTQLRIMQNKLGDLRQFWVKEPRCSENIFAEKNGIPLP